MATQTIQSWSITGESLTMKLYTYDSDTVVDSASASESTNRKGLYSASFTNLPADTYIVQLETGAGVVRSFYWVTTEDGNGTFQAYEIPGQDIAAAVWNERLTGSTHNNPTSAGRRLRTLSDTVILKDGDTIAADNAGTINGENSLGRIKLQPDVGTVCVGQAIRVADQVRYIEAYDAATQYATVDSGWCSIPEVGDEYTIFNLRNALIQKIASADEGTIAYPVAKLWELLEDSSGYRFTDKALEQVQATGDIDGYSLEEALKLVLSALAGKVSGGGTTEITFRAADDSKDRIVATVTSAGNRTSITLDADD